MNHYIHFTASNSENKIGPEWKEDIEKEEMGKKGEMEGEREGSWCKNACLQLLVSRILFYPIG